MKRALVLSGGGSRGAFQVGVLSKIKDIKFDFVSGISAGAINAYMVAQDKIDELETLWKSLNTDLIESRKKSFLTSWFTDKYPSFRSLDKVKKLLLSAEGKFTKELRVGAADLISGKYFEATQNDKNLIDYIVGSASIPLVFSPQEINNRLCVDGIINNMHPLKSAVDSGADEIVVILTSIENEPTTICSFKNPLHVLLRTFDIMVTNIYHKDIKLCKLKNQLNNYRKIKIHLFQPKFPLNHFLDFSPEKIEEMIKHGKEVGEILDICY